jgi:hypothetical protein
MNQDNRIKCPDCGNEIDVNSILSQQLEEEYKHKYNLQIAEERKKLDAEFSKLEQEKVNLEELKKKQDSIIQEQLSKQLQSERAKLEKQIKTQIAEEQSERFSVLEKELKEKSDQIKELNKTKAEIEKLKREKEELKESIEAEAQKMINQKISEEKEKIRKFEQEKNELAIKELQKQLEDQKKLTEEMIRKQEQGSMQLQGEVQELAIEQWLSGQFPLDTIEEIKKGERGADCLQIVNTPQKQNCGTIYYESKRTKEFKTTWIEKFKEDIRIKGANVGVLVTEVLPKGFQRMGLMDGIWVCTFEEFKGLSMVLRENIILISQAIASQENKGEKMVMLYDFLTSNEFKNQIEAIVEGFTQMQIDLQSEIKAITGHWKKREKQIQKVLLNTNHMYNSIKGIAGAAIQPIQQLEFPKNPDMLEEE